MMNSDRLTDLFSRLMRAYGPQGWWPGDDDPLEVIVGSILTQRCSWRNANRALAALREAGLLSLDGLREGTKERIERTIRPAGFYRSKTATLKAVAAHVAREHDGDIAQLLAAPMGALRNELLSIRGIGEETADAILLYAAGQPSFVIDAYMRRILERLGWSDGDESYAELRTSVMDHLPAEVALFNEYHALIVRHGKDRCRLRPLCAGCPLGGICAFSEENPAKESS